MRLEFKNNYNISFKDEVGKIEIDLPNAKYDIFDMNTGKD